MSKLVERELLPSISLVGNSLQYGHNSSQNLKTLYLIILSMDFLSEIYFCVGPQQIHKSNNTQFP